jgi:transcriptional regulator with XRE-family HTH domain
VADQADSWATTFGKTAKALRQAKKLTQTQVGARIGYTKQWLSMVELGERSPKRDAVELLDEALGTEGLLVELYDKLTNATVPGWMLEWEGEERQAKELRSFELAVFSGLLQTEDYAQALLDHDETGLALRLRRQEILSFDDPPMLRCVIDEGVLRREVGGHKVMKGQLEHLLAVSSSKLSIQVIPSGSHKGINGSFTLVTKKDGSDVAYLETNIRGLVTNNKGDLAEVATSWESIRENALPVSMSKELIQRLMEELWG